MKKVKIYIVVLCLFTFLLSSYKITDYDAWLHLALGRWIMENHALPRQERFSHTAYGAEYLAHEWLADVLYYSCWRLGEVTSLQISKTFIFIAAMFLLFLVLLRLNSLPLPALMMCVLCLIGSRRRLMARPTTLSFLLLMILLFLLVFVRRKSLKLTLVPLLTALWANMHPGVLYGLMLLYSFAAYHIVRFLWFLRSPKVPSSALKKNMLFILLLSIIGTVAACATPTLHHALLYPFYMKQDAMFSFIGTEEWIPPQFTPYFTVFWLVLAGTVISLILRWKNNDYRFILYLFLCGYLALYSRRSIMFFLPAASLYLGPALSDLYRRFLSLFRKKYLSIILESALILALALLSVRTVQTEENLYTFGFGINANSVPVDLPHFVEKNDITGNAYNSYSIGSFISFFCYPEIKIFQDGRNLTFKNVYRSFRKHLDNPGKLFDELFPVEMAFVNYQPREFPQIIAYFSEHPQWALVWWDDVTMLFLKRTERFAEIIERNEFMIVNKYEPEQLQSPDRLGKYLEELERAGKNAPSSKRIHYYKGRTLLKLNQPQKALEQLEAAASKYDRSGTYHFYKTFALMMLQRTKEASESIDAAASLSPDKPFIWMAKADIEIKTGRIGEALDALKKARDLQPQNERINQMIEQLERTGDR